MGVFQVLNRSRNLVVGQLWNCCSVRRMPSSKLVFSVCFQFFLNLFFIFFVFFLRSNLFSFFQIIRCLLKPFLKTASRQFFKRVPHEVWMVPYCAQQLLWWKKQLSSKVNWFQLKSLLKLTILKIVEGAPKIAIVFQYTQIVWGGALTLIISTH